MIAKCSRRSTSITSSTLLGRSQYAERNSVELVYASSVTAPDGRGLRARLGCPGPEKPERVVPSLCQRGEAL